MGSSVNFDIRMNMRPKNNDLYKQKCVWIIVSIIYRPKLSTMLWRSQRRAVLWDLVGHLQ